MFRLTRLPRPLRARRFYNYNHFQQLHARPSRFKRVVLLNFWLVSCTAFAYYMWWPKHTFPRPVAAILRKALWAESDKGEYDHELALKHYLEALEECHAVGVDPLSDEYTGIQLKAAEMYERLGMMDDAAFTYNEIATMYLAVLKAPPDSEQGSRVRGIDHRAHLIQKDLRVALKLVELNRPNPSLCKAILITHLLIAQDEVNRKLGLPAGGVSLMTPDFEQKLPERKGARAGLSKAEFLEKYGDDEAAVRQIEGHEDDILVVESNPQAWEPFKDEFFTALDMLSAICVSVGDIKAASSVRVAMTNKMLLAGVAPDKLLLSQCNTASLLYFQAEQLQAEEQNLRKKFSEAANVDHDKVKAIHDHLHPDVDEKEAAAIRDKIAKVVSAEDQAAYGDTVSKRKQMIDMVIATYESVLQGSKNLPAEAVRDSVSLSETVALATYGLGVVHLHLADYDRAERLLREARVRCKGCGYDALIEEVERELGKLFAEKKLIESQK